MRKFYFLTLMAATALSMSAVECNITPNEAFDANLKSENLIRKVAVDSKSAIKAPAKVTDYESEVWVSKGAGKYIASAIAECYGGTTDPVDVEIFEADGANGLYKIVGVWPDIIDGGVLYIDATDPEFVVVENQFTGITDKVDGNTYVASASWVYTQSGGTKDDFIANYADDNITLVDKVIYIPASALLINWPEAPEDSKYETDPTAWYEYGENEGAVILPGGEYVDPWSEAVDATIYDAILSPTFGTDYSAPYTVQIKYNSNSKTYRVIGIWRKLFSNLGATFNGPDLDIDASDPTNLFIDYQTTGINGGTTSGTYYIMSYSYYTEGVLDDSLKITLTENENGTSTISFPYHSMLLHASTSNKIYYACNDQTNLAYITFKTIAGVNDIIADKDNSNAPVEYFNLQGVRVANPAAGQLVIKRQGSEVTKMVVR